MLAALAVNWTFLVLRASIAAIFGIVVLVWPGLTSWELVMLFGAYAAVDGVLALIVAFSVKGLPGFGSLLFEALVRLGVAMCAFAAPGRTALALDTVFGAWAIVSGVAAIAVAIALRRDLAGEWPLPLAGAVSLLAGTLLVAGLRAPEVQWVIGPYALIFALTLVALALRLRQLAYEIA
jgi:uncharacterized membrane protein HdeD (DUF308 family)